MRIGRESERERESVCDEKEEMKSGIFHTSIVTTTVDYRRETSLKAAVNCPLPTAHCPLSTVHCPLSTVHCPLSTVHCPLSPVHCPLSTVHCPLSTVHCPLSTVHCPLSPVHCPVGLTSPRILPSLSTATGVSSSSSDNTW